jgi:hypothetical protein
MSCVHHDTVGFAEYLKENSSQLVKIVQEGSTVTLEPRVINTYHNKTVLLIDKLIETKRVDLTPFYDQEINEKLIIDINNAFHEAILFLASKKHLIPYIEGLR